MPKSSSPPFTVSTREWTLSDSIPALPEKKAAVNFETAIIRFVEIAAMIALGLLLLRLRASGRTLRAMSLLIHVACDLWTGVVSLISSAELWRPSFELPKDQWQWPAFGSSPFPLCRPFLTARFLFSCGVLRSSPICLRRVHIWPLRPPKRRFPVTKAPYLGRENA